MKLKNVPRHITFRCSFCIAKIMMTVKVRFNEIRNERTKMIV